MKILFIGDIVGSPGREAVRKILPLLNKEFNLDFVIANAENSAGGSGLTQKVTQELFDSGADVLTSGDHVWKKREIIQFIDNEPRLLRPLNYPPGSPGRGSGVFMTKKGIKVGVINVLGCVFMEALDCPFRTIRAEIDKLSAEARIIIVDIHAEATSEKVAMGWYLDGIVSAIIGTHTHIPTADEKILPKGTAYLTDCGMCGAADSVIGRRVEDVLIKFVTKIPTRFEVATGNVRLQGVVLDIDEESAKAKSIMRIERGIPG
jgi:hypothetical protein